MKYEKPLMQIINLEVDATNNSGRDNGSSIGWGSCCYNDN